MQKDIRMTKKETEELTWETQRYKMLDTLDWVKSFMNNYDKKHPRHAEESDGD